MNYFEPTYTQLQAMNSGITKEKVEKYETHIDECFKPTIDQQNAMNSGITSLKVQEYDNLENKKQNALTDSQLEVLQSGLNYQLLEKLKNKQDPLTLVDGYDETKNLVLKCKAGQLVWEVE